MLKFHTTYIIPDIHNLLKNFYQIKLIIVTVILTFNIPRLPPYVEVFFIKDTELIPIYHHR